MESVQKDRQAIIAYGGNLASPAGTPQQTICRALASLSGPDLRLTAISRLYRSPAFPAGSGPDYINGAALARTTLGAPALLERLHAVEAELGRVRTGRWHARAVDLDLIGMQDLIAPDPETVRHWIDLGPAEQRKVAPEQLILPHPRLQDRAFVLVPLAEIAPCWRHPLTGLSVTQMLDALPLDMRAGIVPI
jgi:2-amino-4-hydroxy-6-hydroxymethyldihydropteridine diphosphokinase